MAGDCIGRKFNMLLVIEENPERDYGHISYVCQCDCGNKTIVRGTALRIGSTKSCGCIGKVRYGKRYLREYRIWIDMKTRCCNPKCKSYPYYGGRGISISPLWINSFDTFYNDMGACPAGLTLDRIDNNGNYENGNCKWSTRKEQVDNRRPYRER